MPVLFLSSSSSLFLLCFFFVDTGYHIQVGVLDVDLCGPSMAKILGLEGKEIHQSSAGWIPVYADKEKRLCCVSIAFLLPDPDAAVVWRGPKKNATIKQFLEDVCWGELDYLIVDTPPGTSDEHISITELLSKFGMDGAVIVTTPQNVALTDVRKEISFCEKLQIPILGLLENMSGYTCPHCAECTNIFSSGGGKSLCELRRIRFLGALPIDPRLGTSMEDGVSVFDRHPDCSSLQPLVDLANELTAAGPGAVVAAE
mmetsp:Transcript_37563/g.94432  ORF Transcript_37563/g.94432 Transcript_37563/m.94432 type:complete len:257 (+) Transcript_37563:358-1128(+)